MTELKPVSHPKTLAGTVGPNEFHDALIHLPREAPNISWFLARHGETQCEQCAKSLTNCDWVCLDWEDELGTQTRGWSDLKLAAINLSIRLNRTGEDASELNEALKMTPPVFKKVILCADCAVEAAHELMDEVRYDSQFDR